MRCQAVVDTNVIVSALITKNPDSPPRQVFRAMLAGDIIPLYHADILAEYEEVLCREKFHLQIETIKTILQAIREFGIEVVPRPTGEILVDEDPCANLRPTKSLGVREPVKAWPSET